MLEHKVYRFSKEAYMSSWFEYFLAKHVKQRFKKTTESSFCQSAIT